MANAAARCPLDPVASSPPSHARCRANTPLRPSPTHALVLTTSRSLQGVPQPSPFNASKLALLVENRPLPILAPLTLHFISVLPPDWRVLFLGSPPSLAAINASAAIRTHARAGKLVLRPIPANMSTAGPEMISRFLTAPWLYETAVAPAEWLLVFQADSMLCANSKLDVDGFLGYDWLGAPWNPEGDWGGNGGLSLRRVSRIVDILRNQERANDTEPEDVWLTERLAHYPNSRTANGSVSLTFSGEMHSGVPEQVVDLAMRNGTIYNDGTYVKGMDDWRDGFYEPMGYHTGGSGVWLHGAIWGLPEMRQHIYNYCPEVKMTLAMDVARYVPGTCGIRWG
ncbi:hypothetical protein TOPH_07409 [Tolypocladium ophioglossoides CBS 100239]|uniref:DUF5672 domain-containing protein n=1 Tax=Tolypocladium ophioglossoides (strain CBS 100239) TaxID=1163406 RepID=A0A0L0N282_TOLOC|nr:hypothetical protein TOPH_07409 [Tolypocladium ophioglossoides CBS 100239]